MKLITTMLLTSMVLALSACNQEKLANRGFSLPDGDAENGRLLFMQYNCIQCHVLAGTEFVGDDQEKLSSGDGIAVMLGGPVTKVQSYGDLVTSVINPSHRLAKGYPLEEISDDGESKMAYYNDVLTVAELIDLVTFLKSKYELKRYPETTYPFYIYPG